MSLDQFFVQAPSNEKIDLPVDFMEPSDTSSTKEPQAKITAIDSCENSTPVNFTEPDATSSNDEPPAKIAALDSCENPQPFSLTDIPGFSIENIDISKFLITPADQPLPILTDADLSSVFDLDKPGCPTRETAPVMPPQFYHPHPQMMNSFRPGYPQYHSAAHQIQMKSSSIYQQPMVQQHYPPQFTYRNQQIPRGPPSHPQQVSYGPPGYQPQHCYPAPGQFPMPQQYFNVPQNFVPRHMYPAQQGRGTKRPLTDVPQ